MNNSVLKLKPLLLWWFCFSIAWGIYRLFPLPEFFSEVIAKPVIWLGFVLLFLKTGIIPKKIFTELKLKFSNTNPIFTTFFLPTVFIIVYFFVINSRALKIPEFSFSFLAATLVINFSTGIVEEIVYRGVMYVWLLKMTTEVKAFVIVQFLFLLGHVPILIINSESVTAALTHAFFILLLGGIHTMIFRMTKSIYASSLTHGIWNSLVYYFLIW